MSKFSDYFKVVAPQPSVTGLTDNQHVGDGGTYTNYSWYQRLVQGSASRLTKYREYEMMDNDVEISRSLDTLAEEMTGADPNSDLPFELVMENDKDLNINTTTVVTLRAALRYWNSLHSWNTRMFKVARTTIKYGDTFFIRGKLSNKWEYIPTPNIKAAIVDEKDVTKVIGWQIKHDSKVAQSNNAQYNYATGNTSDQQIQVISADDVVWFSLNDDISDAAPFGESVLRAIHKAQKQKDAIEEAIIIYRMKSAPLRRAFYVDVGKMPPQRVKAYLEGFKNEIRQRKVPSSSGGTTEVDAIYNPQQMEEDYFFASREGGNGTKVDTLQAGQSLGEMADLEFFQNKVFRGLRIPTSFVAEGNQSAMVNNGKTGIAYIQELRFANYIKRLQGYLNVVIDKEFKRYLKHAGFNVDPSTFRIKLHDPENFGIYRQQQLDSDLLSTYIQADNIAHLSKRFTQKKFLQLTDEEILLNYKQRCEELGLDPNSKDPSIIAAVYGSSPDGGSGLPLSPPPLEMTAGGIPEPVPPASPPENELQQPATQ